MKRLILILTIALALCGCKGLAMAVYGLEEPTPPPPPPSAETEIMAEAVQYYPDGQLKSRTRANRDSFSAPTCPTDEPCEVKLKTNHQGAGLDVTYRFQGVNQDLQGRQQTFNNQLTADQHAAYREDLARYRADLERYSQRAEMALQGVLNLYGGSIPANVIESVIGVPVGPPREVPDGN